MKITRYINILVAVAMVWSATIANAQKKYDDIYNELPNLSLDQAYSMLLAFQKQNPYFANTYLQLGVICEHKMVLTDPLRDINSAQFWSDQAHLFYGNFNVFYKEGDYRSNEEYYENLRIPHEGEKVKESDIKEFVNKHEAKCKGFKDTTMMIYESLEKSKAAYDRCMKSYMAMCEKYANYNELLLGYDKKLEERMSALVSDIAECEKEFKNYKSLITAYPLLNYRQLYERKEIETFRLDGLTNSDFLENRFAIWDFKKWVDQYKNAIEGAIMPLRKEIEKINAQYANRKSQMTESPLDERFIYRLGKYDNSSLVRELFAYLESRRELVVMGNDSIALNVDSSYVVMNRKMRHIYNMSAVENEVKRMLENMQSSVTQDRVNRFVEFFDKNYGGIDGLKALKNSEIPYIERVMDQALDNFAKYRKAAEVKALQPAYSGKTAKNAALPLWKVGDYEIGNLSGNYVTSIVARDVYGRPAYVAGVKKADLKSVFVAKIDESGNTAWLIEAKKVENVKTLMSTADGCVMTAEVEGRPTAISYSDAGKEMLRFELGSGELTTMRKGAVTKQIKYAYTGESGKATYYVVDSLGVKEYSETFSDIERVDNIQEVSAGTMLIGTQSGKLAVKIVGNGTARDAKIVKEGSGIRVERVFRASAREICIFVSDGQGKQGLVIVSDGGEVVKTI